MGAARWRDAREVRRLVRRTGRRGRSVAIPIEQAVVRTGLTLYFSQRVAALSRGISAILRS